MEYTLLQKVEYYKLLSSYKKNAENIKEYYTQNYNFFLEYTYELTQKKEFFFFVFGNNITNLIGELEKTIELTSEEKLKIALINSCYDEYLSDNEDNVQSMLLTYDYYENKDRELISFLNFSNHVPEYYEFYYANDYEIIFELSTKINGASYIYDVYKRSVNKLMASVAKIVNCYVADVIADDLLRNNLICLIERVKNTCFLSRKDHLTCERLLVIIKNCVEKYDIDDDVKVLERNVDKNES